MKKSIFFLCCVLPVLFFACKKKQNELKTNNLKVVFSSDGFPFEITYKNKKDTLKKIEPQICFDEKCYKLKLLEFNLSQNKATSTYIIDTLNLKFIFEYKIQQEKGADVLSSNIKIYNLKEPSANTKIILPYGFIFNDNSVWVPLREGKNYFLKPDEKAIYKFCGFHNDIGAFIALPIINFNHNIDSFKVACLTDPYFSVNFSPNNISWTYQKNVKTIEPFEQRNIYWVFYESKNDPFDWLYKFIIPEIESGPEWLKEIAMVNYDYMSDGGKGWYNDLKTLSEYIPENERKKILFVLHSWYDHVGQYSFDWKNKKFFDKWTVFSNYDKVKGERPPYNLEGVKVSLSFNNCKPLEMTLQEVHNRIDYAKKLGFRVAMYFADGTNTGDELPYYSPDKVLYEGGWVGPDTKGKVVCQNPSHPEVYRFFVEYMEALLNEFGKKVDAFVWDESFVVKVDNIGPKPYNHYAARDMMKLTNEITQKVQQFNKTNQTQIAFLGCDVLGGYPGEELWAPYSVMTHGTYQDAHCRPNSWLPAIFPNYRNVVWSCMWWPISRWDWVEFGVKNFQAPVSISNGWGDDIGFFEMNNSMKNKVLELFNYRKNFNTNLKDIVKQ